MRVALVDYGAANLGSVARALVSLGATVRRARTPTDLEDVRVIVLPGVGAWGAAMRTLHAGGLCGALRAAHQRGTPIVGVCLGLQLLFERSDESPGVPGLGLLPGRVRRLRAGALPLPHLGWAPVDGVPYYFAHAYCVEPADLAAVEASAWWGETFPAVVRRGSLTGVQFHPERSGPAGRACLSGLLAAAVA